MTQNLKVSFKNFFNQEVPVKEELCSSSNSSHVSSRHKNTHLNHCLKDLHNINLQLLIWYFVTVLSHEFQVQSAISRKWKHYRKLRTIYLVRILLINSIKYIQQAFSDIWAYTAKGQHKYIDGKESTSFHKQQNISWQELRSEKQQAYLPIIPKS